jgi:hypothetical protein
LRGYWTQTAKEDKRTKVTPKKYLITLAREKHRRLTAHLDPWWCFPAARAIASLLKA